MGFGSKPQKAEKTGQEVATEQRQARQLDEEIGKSEKSLKALARNKIGKQSLLRDGPKKAAKEAIKPPSAAKKDATSSGGGAFGNAVTGSGLIKRVKK